MTSRLVTGKSLTFFTVYLLLELTRRVKNLSYTISSEEMFRCFSFFKMGSNPKYAGTILFKLTI
jgi:hypothetical protein